jgi:catechol 2,3-dioxygenase-like lactoylglutathione lyase family enzyme
VIAAELEYASWVELKETSPVTTSLPRTNPADVQFGPALACVFVTDFDRSLAFHRDRLGFDVGYTYGEPQFWGEVRIGDAAFNLRHVDTTPWAGDDRKRGQLLSVSIVTSDAKGLFLRYQDQGVEFHQRLREQPWRRAEFVVRDADGNLVLFGSPDWHGSVQRARSEAEPPVLPTAFARLRSIDRRSNRPRRRGPHPT